MSDPYRLNDIDVAEGHSKRMDCPKCKSKNTFTVSKQQGVLLYNCYKLGCGLRGTSLVGLTASEVQTYLRSRKAMRETLEQDIPTMEVPTNFSYDLSDNKVQAFIRKWQLQNVPMLYDIAACRLHFMIFSAKGRLIDTVGRTLRGDVPKWLRTTGKADYYDKGEGKVAIIVEDVISACAVAKHVPNATGFALLGTSMSGKHFEALQKYERVVVALDADAWSKTIQFTQQLKSRSISATAVKLIDDPKY